VLALGGIVTPLLRRLPSFGGLQGAAEQFSFRAATMPLVVVVAAGLLIGFSVSDVVHAALNGAVWQRAAAAAALASFLPCLVYLFTSWHQAREALETVRGRLPGRSSP
jgi:hypothetical protein